MSALKVGLKNLVKFEMVKNLLNVGTPIEFIIKATGWSEDQILKATQSN